MSAAGLAFVTPHAVRQFIARIDRRCSYEQALGRIIRGLTDGVTGVAPPIPCRDGGASVHVHVRGDWWCCVLTIVYPSPPRPGDLPVVVTVVHCRRGSSAGRGRPRRIDRTRARAAGCLAAGALTPRCR